MNRLLLPALLILVSFSLANQSFSNPGFQIQEDFTEGFNSSYFQTAQTSAASIDTSENNFRVTTAAVPPGSQQYGALEFKCLLSGNIDVSVDYNINSFPLPNPGYNNGIHLYVRSYPTPYPNFSLSRSAHPTNGQSYSLCINDCGARHDFVNSDDDSGKLRIIRIGDVIQAYYFSWDANAFVPFSDPYVIGTQDLRLVIMVYANFTGSALDASFDNLSISSDAVHCPNVPPIVDAGGPYDVDEGSSVVVTASGSDPEGDPLTFAWDLDNDGTFETPGQSATFSAATLDGPSSYNIAVQATDSGGLSATDTAIVNVLNVAPTVGDIAALVNPVQLGLDISLSAGLTDPCTLDTHTAEWDWGNNTTSSGTVTEANGSGTVTGSHKYEETGVYEVTLTVTDDDGGIGTSVFQYAVVYDPSAGFVTGGGWIDSPAGAYVPDGSLAGKANFGFVSKYKKGADAPSGNTEFHFRVADLNFHSNSYDWLVVAGANAKYKGVGTINGIGNYGFMLTATDEALTPSTDVDLFRIKIWDKGNNDTLVYDNRQDLSGDEYGGTGIGGGSIIIHSGSSPAPAKPTKFALQQCYPNPFNPDTWIPYQLAEDVDVIIRIYDAAGRLVRTLNLGNKSAGFYTTRDKAAYWDGKNEAGEHVASGVYFYAIQAGDFIATKKMIMAK